MKAIPPARREAVLRAFRHAFGVHEIPALQPIKGGVSGALVLRFGLHNRSYVLRIEPERVALADRERHYAAMVAAAAVRAAPAVHYASAADGVAVMDYVRNRPLSEHPGGTIGLLRALGALVAKVQAAPPFPAVGFYPDAIAWSLGGLAKTDFLSSGEIEGYAEDLARIRAALSWDAGALVSAHNDPNPRNLLFDGERLWLVDWELAFLNDPLVDVAILTTEFAQTPELEEALLQASFGVRPTRQRIARLAVIRLLTRLYYGCVVLDSLSGMPAPDVGESARSPSAFRAALAEGRLKSGSPETAFAFGMMSLAAFKDGLAEPGFDETLRCAQEG